MKKTKISIVIIAVIFSTTALSAQENLNKNSIPGSWLGKISTGTIDLRLIFNIKLNDKDSLTATADSPDQGAKGIPLGKVTFKENDLTIEAPSIRGVYNGIVTSDSTIDGIWTQAGKDFAVNLTKLHAAFTLNRPQEPKPPFPYTSEDVTFNNDKFNIKLAGTLTIPSGQGPFKAVIMITGSGGQNRNEELMGHKPFLVIADYLTRKGIAVLRYDDRGIGKSEGKYAEANSADLATDAEAALNFLKKNPVIIPGRIGLIGHSEGGLIAPILASTDPDVGFIVSLAGPGVTGEQIILRQSQDISRASGINETDIKETSEINKKLFTILIHEKDNEKAEEKITAAYTKILKKKKTGADDIEKQVNQLKMSFGQNQYTWLRYFMVTDPAEFWKKVKCPVLALNGEKDLQVAADENLPAIEKALKGNNTMKTVSLPGLNHLFQHATTGAPSEYNKIDETFSNDALKIISDWILSL